MSASHPASAATTLASGADAHAPLPRARIAAILAPANPPKLKFLDKLIAEQKQFNEREDVISNAAGELAFVVAALKQKAEAEEWSQRQLAEKIGTAPRTWRRIERATVNPAEWLPKLLSACARLHVPTERKYTHG